MSVRKRSPLWRHFQEVDGNFFIVTYILSYILTQATSREWPVTTAVWLSGGGRKGKLEVNALIRTNMKYKQVAGVGFGGPL